MGVMREMKKFNLLMAGAGLMASALTFSSCVNENGITNKEYKQSTASDFDFATVKNVNLSVKYDVGNLQNEICFEIYDEMPVEDLGYTSVKKDNVKPLFSAYTDGNGSYNGTIQLPAYCSNVYVYSSNLFAPRLLEGTVENGVLEVKQPVYEGPSAKVESKKAIRATYYDYDSYMVTGGNSYYNDGPWKTWLGYYDWNGYVNYQYMGNDPKLKVSATEASNLYNAFSQVIYAGQKNCPAEYRCFTDLNVTEDAEVAVTFLGGNTCWNSSLGYYFYKAGEAPKSLSEANVIMLFPNTQDGGWSNDWRTLQASANAKGVERGTTVQLKYYPNIKNNSRAGETTVFPAGYRIGFVLATNAYTFRVAGYNYTQNNQRYRAATTAGLSVKVDGTPYANETRTAAFKYGDHVMISFEDHDDDNNFSDVVLALSANPIKAINNVPVVDVATKKSTVNELGGVYAFEDLWPHKGDYDMNDVVARYESSKTFGPGQNSAQAKGNTYYEESATFTLFQNLANKKNSFAVKLANDNGVRAKLFKKRADSDEFDEVVGFTYMAADNVYVLTNNVVEDIDAKTNMFKLVVNYGDKGCLKEKPLAVYPFIFRRQANGKLLEVHLPKEAPTSEVDWDLFTTGDDCSNPATGDYYVRGGNYPFAIFLSGETESVLGKILDFGNEAKKIDNLFPNYIKWVNTSGKEATDWYK